MPQHAIAAPPPLGRTAGRPAFGLEWVALMASLLLLALLVVWSLNTQQSQYQVRERERLQLQVRVLHDNMVTQLTAIDSALRSVVGQLPRWRAEVDGDEAANAHVEALSNAMPGVRSVFYLDAQGRVRAFSLADKAWIGRDVSDEPYFHTVRLAPDPGRLYISAPFVTRLGAWVINVARMVPDAQGRFAGVVGANIEVREFQTLLNSVLYAADMQAAISHDTGVQYVRMPGFGSAPPPAGRLTLSQPVQPAALRMDHALVVEVSRDEVAMAAPIEQLRRTYWGIFIAVAVGAAAALLGSQIVRERAWRKVLQVEGELYRREEELARFFEVSVDVLAVVDTQGRCQQLNDAWARVLGQAPDALLGSRYLALVHPADVGATQAMLAGLANGEPGSECTNRMRHADGGYRDLQWKAVKAGDTVCLSGRDITAERRAQAELAEAHAQLEQQHAAMRSLAYLDGLTGVANRRRWDEVLGAEWRAGQREAQPLAVLLIDIDHFKRYNDHYGHQQGDACLRTVAQTLQACAQRPRDLVARYGGEEFAVLLPQTDLAGAVAKAEQAVAAVAALGMAHENSPTAPVVTVSVGVAARLPQAGESAEGLVHEADAALYQAKAAGRNRVADGFPSPAPNPERLSVTQPAPAGRISHQAPE